MKTLIAPILLLLTVSGYGQQNLIPNGNFESVPTTGCNAVQPTVSQSPGNFNQNVNDWQAAEHNNETSDISLAILGEALLIDQAQCASDPIFNTGIHSCSAFPSLAFSGTKFALIRANYSVCGALWGHSRAHGAIGSALPNGSVFDNGKTYIVRYKIMPMASRNLDNGGPFCSADNDGGLFCHIRFFLSENTPPTWNDNTSDQQELYSVSYQEQLADDGSHLTPCGWKQVEREFTANQGNYTSLIIYCESGGAAIDDVEIFEKCEATKTIQNKVYPSATGSSAGMGFNVNEQAGDNLLAGNNVNSNMTTGDVVVAGNSKVNFTAPNSIALLPGFSAQANSIFAAVILGCPNSLNRIASNSTNENPDPGYIAAPPMKRNQELAAEKKSLKKMSEQAIIFPNPAKNSISYKADRIPKNSRFVIVNIMNQVLVEQIMTEEGTEVRFDLSGLSQGIYFLNRYDGKGSMVSSNKIMKD